MLIKLFISLLLLNLTGAPSLPLSAPFLVLEKDGYVQSTLKPYRINEENLGVVLTADKYAVLDVSTGQILSEKDSSVVQPIASITKLMTALVIYDQNPDWQKPIEFTAEDEIGGAKPNIYRGEQVKFSDVWKTALIASDNNAIEAMVRSLGFSTEDFAELMNQKAWDLKLYHTSFVDPTGLAVEDQSTALEVAQLVYYAMQKNEIRESVLQPSYQFPILNSDKVREIKNTDVLLGSFLNHSRFGYELVGGKTGYIPEAGYCLAVEIAQNNQPVIFVVLNSDTIGDRFQDVKALADWTFSNYIWK